MDLSVPAETAGQRKVAGPAAASCGSWWPTAREEHPLELFSANERLTQPAGTAHPPEGEHYNVGCVGVSQQG